jgi:peptide/nickel transport system substrate-binding protein
MHTFLSFIKEFHIPTRKELRSALASFSKKERVSFAVVVLIAVGSLLFLLAKLNDHFMATIPVNGGSITEGIVGMPTLINPVLALSDADKDLTAVVYSGLMRKEPDGTFIPDLAQSYTVSPDGTAYTFVIRSDATFQDGTPVTANDVVFTINKIQDQALKSPRAPGWDGVSVSKTDDHTVVFTLKQPYISFMDNMTIGILPSHLWQNLSDTEFSLSDLNINAIGSGPFQITSVAKDANGIPQKYTLTHFSHFTLGVPHIKTLKFVSFANEKDMVDALVHHSIDQASSISPENAQAIQKAGFVIHTGTLPRIFGIFFNSANNKIFADASVRKAIDEALDRTDIVNEVLNGYGNVIHSPIPETILPDQATGDYAHASIDQANALLDQDGWTMGPDGIRQKGGTSTKTETVKVGKKSVQKTVTVNNGPVVPLTFSLTTGDTPELKATTLLIKEQLEKIGVNVNVKVYGTGELDSLIRSRGYEALFFGEIINHESDLFSFWHSSQRADPGLNIAMYDNSKVDTILQTAEKTLDADTRHASYAGFISQFNVDVPAVLIYSPKYLYATSSNLTHLDLNTVSTPSDRFANIYTWYTEMDHIWKIFTKNK